MGTVEKRSIETDLSNLTEPEMNEKDREDFSKGVVLFNNGQFWQSHEAWEEVWKRHPENSRIFFQGLIQVAAGMHQLQRRIYHGVEKHFRNALWKLKPFQPIFLEVDVENLVGLLEKGYYEISRLGEKNLEKFKIKFTLKIKTF